jgi:hypothetical protein
MKTRKRWEYALMRPKGTKLRPIRPYLRYLKISMRLN